MTDARKIRRSARGWLDVKHVAESPDLDVLLGDCRRTGPVDCARPRLRRLKEDAAFCFAVSDKQAGRALDLSRPARSHSAWLLDEYIESQLALDRAARQRAHDQCEFENAFKVTGARSVNFQEGLAVSRP